MISLLKYMKKRVISLAFILLLSLVSAKISCSDNSSVISDQNEVDLNLARAINNLRIGVSKTESRAVIKDRNLIPRFSADLIIDAVRSSLSSTVSSEKITLSSGSYTATLKNTTALSATIDIDGESKKIEEGETETIKSLVVYLANAEESGEAKIIIGIQKTSLSSDEKPSEKIILGNKTFFVELISASETNAIFEVSVCKTGEIEILEEPVIEQNQTIDASNETAQTNETTNETEQSERQVTVEEVRERLKESQMTNATKNETLEIKEGSEKPGLLKRIISFLKRLFGLS